VELYLDIALIITSISLIISVILQSKGAGLGGLTGADSGTIFTPGYHWIERLVLLTGYSYRNCDWIIGKSNGIASRLD
jgi:preprotein translocase subunit SecG